MPLARSQRWGSKHMNDGGAAKGQKRQVPRLEEADGAEYRLQQSTDMELTGFSPNLSLFQ